MCVTGDMYGMFVFPIRCVLGMTHRIVLIVICGYLRIDVDDL